MTATRPQRLSYLVIAALPVVWLAMALLREHNLRANFYDLGQYAAFVSSIWQEGAFEMALSTHAQPFLLLLSIAGATGHISWTLLVIQALIAGLGGWIFVRHAPADCRLQAALLFATTLAVWFTVLNDFHLEHLLLPFYLAFVVLLIEPGQRGSLGLVALALAMCAVKEPYALTAAAGGVLAFAMGRRLAGLAIVVVSLGYFWIATGYVIPAFTQGRSTGEIWAAGFGHLGRSPFEMGLTILRDPFGAVLLVITWRKLLFVAVMTAPFVYLIRFAPLAIIPALPVIGIMLVSSDPNHAYLGHHYAVAVTAAMLGGVLIAAHSMPSPAVRTRALAYSAVVSLITLVLFGPSPVSRLFWSQHAYSFNWLGYAPDANAQARRALVDAHVPLDRAVAVSVQNTLHMDRISARPLALAFPGGVAEPERVLPRTALRVRPGAAEAREGLVLAEFVIIDAKRPMSLGSEVCLWDPARICVDPAFRDRYAAAVAQLRGSFELIASHDGFEIHRRRLRVPTMADRDSDRRRTAFR